MPSQQALIKQLVRTLCVVIVASATLVQGQNGTLIEPYVLSVTQEKTCTNSAVCSITEPQTAIQVLMPFGSASDDVLQFSVVNTQISSAQGTKVNPDLQISMRSSPYVTYHNMHLSETGQEILNTASATTIFGQVIAWDEELCAGIITDYSTFPGGLNQHFQGAFLYFAANESEAYNVDLSWCPANVRRVFSPRFADVYSMISNGVVKAGGYDASMFDIVQTSSTNVNSNWAWPFMSVSNGGLAYAVTGAGGAGSNIINQPNCLPPNLAAQTNTGFIVAHVPTVYARSWVVDQNPTGAFFTIWVDLYRISTGVTETLVLSAENIAATSADGTISVQLLSVTPPSGELDDIPNFTGSAIIQKCPGGTSNQACDLPTDPSAPTASAGVYVQGSASVGQDATWIWIPPEQFKTSCPGIGRNWQGDERTELNPWQWMVVDQNNALVPSPILSMLCSMNNSAALAQANANAAVGNDALPYKPPGYTYTTNGRNMWINSGYGFVQQRKQSVAANALITASGEAFVDVEQLCAVAIIGSTSAYVSTLSLSGVIDVAVCNTQKITGEYTVNIACVPLDPSVVSDVFYVQAASQTFTQPTGCNFIQSPIQVQPNDPAQPLGYCNITLTGCPGNTFYGSTSVWITYLTYPPAPPPGPTPPQKPIDAGGCGEIADLIGYSICQLSYSLPQSLASFLVPFTFVLWALGALLVVGSWVAVGEIVTFLFVRRIKQSIMTAEIIASKRSEAGGIKI